LGQQGANPRRQGTSRLGADLLGAAIGLDQRVGSKAQGHFEALLAQRLLGSSQANEAIEHGERRRDQGS
jgi:hypothetical protein